MREDSEDGDGQLHRKRVAAAISVVTEELGVSEKELRAHMKQVGFDPVNPWTLEHVEACVRMIAMSPWCGKIGASFAETRLRLMFGMVVRISMVRQALRNVDADGVRRRKQCKSKPKSKEYNVKGPRSHFSGTCICFPPMFSALLCFARFLDCRCTITDMCRCVE